MSFTIFTASAAKLKTSESIPEVVNHTGVNDRFDAGRWVLPLVYIYGLANGGTIDPSSAR